MIKEGLEFVLPKEVSDKAVSVIEVGPFNQQALAEEINRFLGTRIQKLVRTDSYVLVHEPDIKDFESLIREKPFVDPVIHQATLNTPLSLKLGLEFDYVLQNMLNLGTTDAYGNVALNQALLSLGKKPKEGDYGFKSVQYFLRGHTSEEDLEELSLLFTNPDLFTRIINHPRPEEIKKAEQILNNPNLFRRLIDGETRLDRISSFLANPDLNTRLIVPTGQYESGRKITAPVVTLNLESKVETFDVINMSDEELKKLNKNRKLAASLEELHQFRDQYKDPEFLKKRRELGLTELATDVEIDTWFGLRSEHCFHKELNARITLRDNSNDLVFRRALDRGILKIDEAGNYIIDQGIFKTFIEEPARRVYNRLEKRGKNWILSMFEDNSGVVAYDENFMFNIKFETHNSPSNKEPIQGSKTGLDGVRRDCKGTQLGTFDLLAGFFFFGTGNPYYQGWLPKGVKHPYEILKGITQGIREAGNETQFPTMLGGLVTDPRYIAKTLVHAGFVGFSKRFSPDGRSYEGKHANVGDKILVIGQAVGIDGCKGAAESSLSASADTSLGHVQADFSFYEAKVDDFILDYARRLFFKDITDCGAMGIGSATHEMAKATGGYRGYLDKHPRKYKGIQNFQVNISETQNRMVAAAEDKDVPELIEGGKLYEVEVTEIGTLTNSGYIHLLDGDKTVALMDINKLFDKNPRKQMKATWNGSNESPNPRFKKSYTLEESLCLIMEQPDNASKEWFFRQKDSSVKGATIQGPLTGLAQEIEADATIQKPLETEGKDYGAIAYAMGFCPKLSDIDPYYSAQKSIIDMIGKIIAVGGRLPDMKNAKWDPWAVCGNYCQPNSDSETTLNRESGEHNLASIVREAIGVSDIEDSTNVIVISGKDSMKCSCRYKVDESFNLEDVPIDLRKHIELIVDKTTGEKNIEIHDPDSYLASCAAKIQDYRKCVNSTFKNSGDLIYIVGVTKNELGASELHQALGYIEQDTPLKGGFAPKADLKELPKICNSISDVIENELVASCCYIHDGGLLTRISKAAMAGNKGAEINPELVPRTGHFDKIEEILYSETPGRFIVTINPEDREKFEKTLGNIPYQVIGKVTDQETLRTYKPDGIEDISLSRVKSSYQKPLRFDLDVAKKQKLPLIKKPTGLAT